MKVLLASDGSSQAKNAARSLRQLTLQSQIKIAILPVSMPPELTVDGNIQNPEWAEQEKFFVTNHQADVAGLFSGPCGFPIKCGSRDSYSLR